MTDTDQQACPFCGGTGLHRPEMPRTPPAEETERQAVSLVTLALDHGIAGDENAYTMEELLTVVGDRPAVSVMALLAAASSITACVVRNASPDDAAARDWWQRIAKHLLSDSEGGAT